jgi:serine/threonine protein kinase
MFFLLGPECVGPIPSAVECYDQPVSTASTPGLDDPSALVGTILADRYRVDERLGEGGMGTVYRAEHIHMRKSVALKVLHPEIAAHEEFAARFEREAIAAGRIDHRNVAKALDFGQLPDGSFYLIMEYVKGQSLRELIREGPRSTVNALEIARQVALAIEAAHAAGVIHRDLKPDNVMIGEPDAQGASVKVLDFGVAKLASDEAGGGSPITRYGAIIGTPEYMAPEQAGGGIVDARADLYALGVILFEMLSGRVPFGGDDRAEILSKHVLEPPPELPASIPQTMRALVSDLLEKDPDARVQTAAELGRRIDAARSEIERAVTVFLPAAPVSQRAVTVEPAPSSTQPTRRVAPLIAGAAVLGLIALTAGAVLALRGRDAPSSSDMLIAASAAAPGPEASADIVAPESAEPEAPSASAESQPAPAPSAEAETPGESAGPEQAKAAPVVPQKSKSPKRHRRKVTIVRRTVRTYTVTRH